MEHVFLCTGSACMCIHVHTHSPWGGGLSVQKINSILCVGSPNP